MKQILTIVLILFGMIGWAQEARLKNFYVTDPNDGDTVWYNNYVYDENNSLQFIYEGFGIDPIWIYSYSNDTLISLNWVTYDDIFYYSYYTDSIIRWHLYEGDTIKELYNKNGLGQIIDFQGTNYTLSFDWEGENVITRYEDGQETLGWTYFDQYLNPTFMENINFRFSTQGSINLVEYTYHSNGDIFHAIIEEAIGPFPKMVSSFKNGVLTNYLHYEYLSVSLDIPEFLPPNSTVLSVEYFDILGRRINKPDKGLYIERKTTDKGSISTKYFRQ